MNAEKKKNILIVDDDPFLQTLYRKTLEREGFNILTAVDGLDAVEMLPNICADLVVLDLMLPKIHGLKVLETIRSNSHHKDLPVLILSNAYLPETAQKAMQAKATTGMLKSECSPKQLVKIIRETLRQASAESAADSPAVEKQPASRGSWFSGLLGGKAEKSSEPEASENKSPTESVGTATSKTEDSVSTSSLEVQNELLKTWPTDIAMIREIGLKYVKSVGTQESEEHLKSLYRRLRLLGARATIGEMSSISQLSNALEAMLFEHGFNIKKSMSPSVLQTMVQAVDCIEFLFKSGRTTKRQITRKNRILLVDDDPVCNMANDLALRRANFDTTCVGDGTAALSLLPNKDFDLILLDVNMPVLSGFEVCKKIRQLPLYKEVPIIFVTINDDFQSRAQSVLSGSNGLISKPISPLELIVKSLVYLLRAQDGNSATEMSLAGQSSGNNRAITGDQAKKPAVDPVKSEGRVKELKATQAAVEDRVKNLTQALAAETKRREEAEQQAAANVQFQAKLETAKVDNQNAHEYFERMLEESKLQAQNSQGNEAWKLEGRNRALESVRNFVQDKVRNLSEVLEVQTKKSEIAKQQAAEFAKQKLELEKALAEIQQAKDNLMREIEAAGDGKLRGDLEAALAENMKSQENLLQKIAKNRQESQGQQPEQVAGESESGAQKPEAADEQHIKALTEALAAEKKRCEIAEQQAAEIANRRSALEEELIKSNKEQEQLRNALAEQQQRLAAQVETQNVELGNVADRTKELEAARAELAALKAQHASVGGQVQSLSGALAAESGRRTTVEQQSAELMARRSELERELTKRTLEQEQLRAELAEKQKLLDAQVQTHNTELGNLSTRTKELETERVAVEDKVKALTEALSEAKKRCEIAELQAGGIGHERSALEAELEQSHRMQEQLRAQLAEQQQRLDAQVQTHNAELGNFSDRLQELEAAQVALAELKARHSGATEQVEALTESLTLESGRRATAEQTAAELAARRTELEAELAKRTQTQEQLHAELSKHQQQLDAQVQTHNAELGNFNERLHELEATQAALADLKAQHAGVTGQMQALSESLKSESDRRVAAEQTAAELATRRAELERELAERSQTQEQLRAELADKQQRLDAQVQNHNAELENFGVRVKELEATKSAFTELQTQHADVTGQVRSLTETLTTESSRRESAEKQSAELAARRTELEHELAQRSQTQEQLSAELAEKQQRLDAEVEAHNFEVKKFEARMQELAAAQTALAELQTQHAGVAEKVQSLTEHLTTESDRREDAEKQVAKLITQRIEMERDIAHRTQAQAQLRHQLAEQEQRLGAEVQAHNAEQGKLVERTKELEAAQTALTELKSQHSSVSQETQALAESLKSESSRRESAEKQSAELAARRSELEQELNQRTQTQEQLRAELAEKQQRLEAQVQVHNVELGKLAERTKELEAAQVELAELKSQHANVTGQVQTLTQQVLVLTESLQTETGRRTNAEKQAAELVTRRTELEQELAQRTQSQEALRNEITEQRQRLDAQAQTHSAEVGKFEVRVKELEAVQGTLAELQTQHAGVTEEVRSLTESLNTETGRREGAENEVAKLVAHRAELEQDIVQRTQTQEQLRTELAAKQQQLDAQVQARNIELGKLTERTKELEAAQTALTELKSQHSSVSQEMQTLAESLKSESSRRESAEKQSAELAARRSELEQELTERTQTQEQLRAELAEKQQGLEAQAQAHNVELGKLAERTKELETTQTALTELKSHHTGVTQQVEKLTESLKSESSRRESAEHQANELVARRIELEQELAQRAQTQEQLSNELTAKQQRIDATVTELAQARRQAETEALQLSGQYAQSEEARTELGRQLNDARQLSANHEAAIRSLETELQKQRGEHDRLNGLYKAEMTHRRQIEEKISTIQSELDETAGHLAKKCTAEQVWLGRESEMQECIRSQRDEITKSSATLAVQDAEIQNSRKKIVDFETHHSALIGKIQDLTSQAQTLNESLTTESARRATVEQQTAELVARRAELEQQLAQSTQSLAQLRAELAGQQHQLAAQVQAHNVEVAKLAERTKELESAQTALTGLQAKHASLTERSQSLSESLTAETGRRETVEKTLTELNIRRTELEQEITSRAQAQEQLRTQLAAQVQAHNVEVAKLAERTKELEATQTALAGLQAQHATLSERAQSLTESLTAETGRREIAEKQLAELNARRVELEQEVARRTLAQEQLRLQLAEKTQAHNIEIANLAVRTKELEATRTELTGLQAQHASLTGRAQSLTESLTAETCRREIAEKQLAELNARRVELEQEIASRAQAQEQLRTQLAEKTQAHNTEIANLAARTKELEATRTELTGLQAQHASLTGRAQSLTESLTAETCRREAAEQVWRGRESELQNRILSQQSDLAKVSASLTGREVEIKNAREMIEELQVLQSALCTKVQDLTRQGEAAAKSIQELKANVACSENAVANGQIKLAGLRYAILDAARMNARLHRERSHKERQSQDVMRRLLSSLAQTPLSLAQRGMLAELQHSVDNLKNTRAGAMNLASYPIELPSLRGSEFSFTEITESVFQAVRAAATAAGVTAQVSASGSTPRRLIGCAEHVHQLITLLAISPITITTGVNALDLRVTIKPKCDRFAEMTLRVALSSDDNGQELLQYLESVTTAAASLQTGSFNEAEIGLAAGWQLAAALGAQAVLELEGGKEVCLVLSLPIEMDSMLATVPADDTVAYVPTHNGNGHHGRNGGGKLNGNGYRLTEVRSEITD